jgi:hypothetical protein
VKMALLRVGLDSAAGGGQGPLFADGSFEFVPIPDTQGVGVKTYGNTLGIKGEPLVSYFPERRRQAMSNQAMHFDPEFETFTYGDPTSPKAGLRRLAKGDMLVFYAGLAGWDHECPPGLYVVGYFVVEWAGLATDLPENEVRRRCGQNFHVLHDEVFQAQRERLVLVKGGRGSRLLRRAHLISTTAINRTGRPLKVLSSEAQKTFGDFDGRISIERSPTRWVNPKFVPGAKTFIEALQ